ncbi:MAG TPA: Abi family protein [Mucilaginibacter sp.]
MFKNEANAIIFLQNVSYYRIKGYWWDMQSDYQTHIFKPKTYFEDIVDIYNFDRDFRLILFDSIERIEIALRTKMIYHLSMAYGGLWYLDPGLFEITTSTINGVTQTMHLHTIGELKKEFKRSKEIFVLDHHKRFLNSDPDAWKIFEVASLGTLSKLYKSLKHQLPEKSAICKEMGLNIHNELSSWLEAIAYVRNIIAHHSRLWSRNMVKQPIKTLNKPIGQWFVHPISPVQCKKPFLIISTMVYLCNHINGGNDLKAKLITLFNSSPNIPIYKLGFLNNWENEPIWQ